MNVQDEEIREAAKPSIPRKRPFIPTIKPGECAFRFPHSESWRPLNEATFARVNNCPSLQKEHYEELSSNKNVLSSALMKALQLPNLAFFAGSGTSLGKVGGPKMWDLWTKSMFQNGLYDELKANSEQLTEKAKAICNKVKYTDLDSPNIEHFLSSCDAYQQVYNDPDVNDFVCQVKSNVLKQCSEFLNKAGSDITSYQTLLRKLAKRRVRDPRLKIFTTNYDMCFENSSANLGMMIVDGFSYTRKRRFDGRYFNYDVVDRNQDGQAFIQGVVQLYKLHGSVSWERYGSDIYEVDNPAADKACLIYPAKGKYQQAFLQPHLELLSRFLEFLRQPNCCLVVSGFGFNDDHLSEPILAAVRSNPSFKLVIADFAACSNIGKGSHYWQQLSELASKGADVTFINATFDDMVDLIPNLAALSPAEKLAESINMFSQGNQHG
ncbi:SIR2 family protein [Vibrio cholerae]|uniref:SIR2 family protein n=1 Tax=Vibrio cholerae TaxID=666 RepID=UPI001A9F18D0|nr:SIR2 family protein [Vibrio cholerae]EKF9275650.1 SIR2 family protein [Vibrio cholerae]